MATVTICTKRAEVVKSCQDEAYLMAKASRGEDGALNNYLSDILQNGKGSYAIEIPQRSMDLAFADAKYRLRRWAFRTKRNELRSDAYRETSDYVIELKYGGEHSEEVDEILTELLHNLIVKVVLKHWLELIGDNRYQIYEQEADVLLGRIDDVLFNESEVGERPYFPAW